MEVSEIVRRLVLPAKNMATLMSNLGLAPGGAALATLGLFPNSIWYVDSAVDSASGGTSWASALGTIDEAINLASAGDVILVAPFHNEGAGNAQIFDCDVAGLTILGLGDGTQRPILDFDHANAVCSVGANDCTIAGFQFRPSVTAVLIGLDLETGVTGTNVVNCEFINGEDGSGTDEFVKAIHLTSGNHDTKIIDTVIRCHVSAGQATHGIHVDAASNRCVYKNVVIDGPYATNGILEDAASADTVVEDCSIDVTGTNYGFVSTSTFTRFKNNRSAKVPVNQLGQEDLGALGFAVTKVSNLADGSGTDDLFTVTGRVMIVSLTGEVTTVIGGAATVKIRDITNSVDLCAATTIDTDAVGTMYALTNIAASILNGTGMTPVIGSVPNLTGSTNFMVRVAGDVQAPITLSQVLDAADTGAITWRLTYIPLVTGATVVAAA